MEGRSYSDQAMALSKLALPRFVVHRVLPFELEGYLNGLPAVKRPAHGAEWSATPEKQVRPEGARLVGVYQEDIGQLGYVNEKPTHAEYRVVWERLT